MKSFLLSQFAHAQFQLDAKLFVPQFALAQFPLDEKLFIPSVCACAVPA
jgi:hypothetical protein